MKTEQLLWTSSENWPSKPALASSAQLVFAFGNRALLSEQFALDAVRMIYPNACIAGCSTGGEILGKTVQDDSLVLSAIEFEKSDVRMESVTLREGEDSFEAGARLARALALSIPTGVPLAHVFVLADGIQFNGSSFVRGVAAELPAGTQVTGGLAADDDRFEVTPLWADELLANGGAVAIGFFGQDLRVGHGAIGGWDPFGPDRLVTHAEGNVLYSLDDQCALGLYKEYLGDHAEQLPASGLLFPLAIRTNGHNHEIVRTTLGVDERNQSITFAGDVPQGAYARFMKTNIERLIDGAVGAAQKAVERLDGSNADFALLVSCVGRKWVMNQRIEEEVEGVLEEVGQQATLGGFYSYGEIAPSGARPHCDLHNQTMTITTFAEV